MHGEFECGSAHCHNATDQSKLILWSASFEFWFINPCYYDCRQWQPAQYRISSMLSWIWAVQSSTWIHCCIKSMIMAAKWCSVVTTHGWKCSRRCFFANWRIRIHCLSMTFTRAIKISRRNWVLNWNETIGNCWYCISSGWIILAMSRDPSAQRYPVSYGKWTPLSCTFIWHYSIG